MIEVKVPATSANMGSGYDSIGIALNLYNTIKMEESDCIDISDVFWCIYSNGRNQPYLSMCKKGLMIFVENLLKV